MKKPKCIKSYAEAIIFIACIIAIIVIPLLRPSSLNFPGTQSYFNLRIGNDFSTYDELSYGGRNILHTAGLPFMINILPNIIINYLPIIFGIFNLILLYFILKKLEIGNKAVVLLIYTFSPTTIYLISTLNNYFVPLFLILTGFLMYQYKKLKIFSIIPFSLICFFNLNMTIITFVLLGVLLIIKKERYIFYPLALWYAFFIFLFSKATNFLFKTAMYENLGDFFIHSISDFGGIYGLGIFAIILAVIGINKEWKYKYNHLLMFTFFTALIFLLIIIKESIILINFFICIFCVKGILHLYKKEWVNETIKILTLFVIISGLMFSFLVRVDQLSEELPNQEIIEAMEYIKELDKGTMFSEITRGHWITFAGMENIIDENINFAPEYRERNKDVKNLFKTRDINIAKDIIKKYDISYIWMDRGIDEKIYTEEEEGLKFILKYSKDFNKIYQNDYVVIYKIEERYIN